MPVARNIPRRKGWIPRFLKKKAFWVWSALVLLCGLAAAGMVLESRTRKFRERAATYDLERINDLEVPSIILDRGGKEIGRIFVQNRSVIPISEVPGNFLQALRAGEDSRFLKHRGIDFIGTIRALKFTAEGSSQGGSTITQQLARNAYNLKEEAVRRGEGTIERKLVEMFLARRIEQRYTKEQILEFYLNRIYFGSGFYGIRSASLGYFGKEPRDLDTAECASLVTLIKNPTGRSPLNDPAQNRDGRDYVLARMQEEGFLDAAETKRLQSMPLTLDPKPLRRGTTHLYERIAEEAGEALGADALAAGGFVIRTTILKEAQEAAEKALRRSLDNAEARPGYVRSRHAEAPRGGGGTGTDFLQGACLMFDHLNGEVLVHVGGRDYAKVPYDFIQSGKRPLGTAFFPFLYAAGLEAGLTPATMVDDEAMDNRSVMVGGREGILGEWGMEIAEPVYRGRITAREALEQSKIGATVRFGDMAGLRRVADTASAFGLPMGKAELLRRIFVGFEEASLRQALRAMSAFALGGRPGPGSLVYIDRIDDASGRIVYRKPSPAASADRVVGSATAWQVHSMLAGSLYRGSSRGALEGLVEKPFPGAGKGGSTADFSDCWFLGYNARVSCGVWTGFLSPGPPIYPGAFSRDLALPVWQAAMNAAAPSFSGGGIAPPEDVVQMAVCGSTGQRATRFCHEYTEDPSTGVVKSRSTAVNEYFRRGTEQTGYCALHSGLSTESTLSGNVLRSLPALDTVPIRPKAPVLLGDDPYHTELPSFAATDTHPGLVRRRTNVLDSLDLGDGGEGIPLPRPRRLPISDDDWSPTASGFPEPRR